MRKKFPAVNPLINEYFSNLRFNKFLMNIYSLI